MARVVDALDASPLTTKSFEPPPNFTIDLPIFHLLMATPANLVGRHMCRALK